MTRIEGVIRADTGANSPLFSVAEAAIYLGMSKDWVYERLKALVPHVKIGGALKFRKEDLDRYITSQIVAPMNPRDIRSPVSLRQLMRVPRKR
jgi:excisionase family DNA binding protein